MQHHYPTVRLGVLQAIAELKSRFDADDSYFDNRLCPYDEETKTLLRGLFAAKVLEKVVLKDRSGNVIASRGRGRPRKENDAPLEVEFEIEDLITEMKNLTPEGVTLETSDKIAIVRAKTALLEKAVGLRERWFNVKRVGQFFATVIGILDDLCPEDVRAEVMKRLEPFRENS